MANISSCSLAGKAVDRYAVDQGNFKDHFLKILKIDRFRILGRPMTNLSVDYSKENDGLSVSTASC